MTDDEADEHSGSCSSYKVSEFSSEDEGRPKHN